MGLALILMAPKISNAGDRIFKPFKVVASLGYAIPKDYKFQYPLDFQLEPKYGFNDNFWLGLRLETAIFVRRHLLEDDYQGLAIFSILPTLDYSLVVNSNFRPFIGVGFGTYTYRNFSDGYEVDHVQNMITKTGFCPRIGFEYKTFNLSFEHNFVNGGIQYSAIKAGFTMGGGLLHWEE